MRVEDKIAGLNLGSPPYFFPLLDSSTPVWKNPCILVAFDYVPPRLDYNNTIIMVESGGYSNPPKDQWICLMKQMRIKPDLAMTLDRPMKIRTKGRKTRLSNKEKRERLAETIANAKYAIKVKDKVQSIYDHEYEPVAVVQGCDLSSMRYCAEEMRSFGYDYYALGVISTSTTHRNVPEIIEQVIEVRKMIGEEAWLHLLGVMDVKIIRQIKLYITSFDASTLTQCAIHGVLYRRDGSTVQLPKHLRPKTNEEYKKLQETNFRNYIYRLHELGIR